MWDDNSINVENMDISILLRLWQCYGSHYVKTSVESMKFTFKVRSESGKLFTIGCHLPPKSTNFETLGVDYSVTLQEKCAL